MEQHKRSNNKVVVIAVAGILVTAAIVFIILIKSQSTSKNLKLLKQLTENNKKLENFQVTLQTKNELIFDENTTSVETNSVLSNRNNFEKAMYKIHTAGKSTFKTEEKFDVTGTFFCLEKDVYESVGIAVVASSITYESFSKMCKEISLFTIIDVTKNLESHILNINADMVDNNYILKNTLSAFSGNPVIQPFSTKSVTWTETMVLNHTAVYNDPNYYEETKGEGRANGTIFCYSKRDNTVIRNSKRFDANWFKSYSMYIHNRSNGGKLSTKFYFGTHDVV